jgi:hypothetical protein
MSTIRKSRTGVTMGQACWSIFTTFFCIYLFLWVGIWLILSLLFRNVTVSMILLVALIVVFTAVPLIPTLLLAFFFEPNPDRTGLTVIRLTVDVSASIMKRAMISHHWRFPDMPLILGRPLPRDRWIMLPGQLCYVNTPTKKYFHKWLPTYYIFISQVSDSSCALTLVTVPEFRKKSPYLDRNFKVIMPPSPAELEKYYKRIANNYVRFSERQSRRDTK